MRIFAFTVLLATAGLIPFALADHSIAPLPVDKNPKNQKTVSQGQSAGSCEDKGPGTDDTMRCFPTTVFWCENMVINCCNDSDSNHQSGKEEAKLETINDERTQRRTLPPGWTLSEPSGTSAGENLRLESPTGVFSCRVVNKKSRELSLPKF